MFPLKNGVTNFGGSSLNMPCFLVQDQLVSPLGAPLAFATFCPFTSWSLGGLLLALGIFLAFRIYSDDISKPLTLSSLDLQDSLTLELIFPEFRRAFVHLRPSVVTICCTMIAELMSSPTEKPRSLEAEGSN